MNQIKSKDEKSSNLKANTGYFLKRSAEARKRGAHIAGYLSALSEMKA